MHEYYCYDGLLLEGEDDNGKAINHAWVREQLVNHHKHYVDDNLPLRVRINWEGITLHLTERGIQKVQVTRDATDWSLFHPAPVAYKRRMHVLLAGTKQIRVLVYLTKIRGPGQLTPQEEFELQRAIGSGSFADRVARNDKALHISIWGKPVMYDAVKHALSLKQLLTPSVPTSGTASRTSRHCANCHAQLGSSTASLCKVCKIQGYLRVHP